jgi:hypothetical protein
MLTMFSRMGLLRDGDLPHQPDADLAAKAREELKRDSWKGDGASLSGPVRNWLYRLIRERPNVPRRRRRKGQRDAIIANVVAHISNEYGLAPTRNRASRQASACSVVSEVLAELGIHLDEIGVEDVWRRLHKHVNPGPFIAPRAGDLTRALEDLGRRLGEEKLVGPTSKSVREK